MMYSLLLRIRALLIVSTAGVCFLSTANAQTDALSLSSGSGVVSGSVSLNLSVTSPAGSEPAGLEWTVNYPASDIVGFTAAAGSVASAAGKTITCLGNTCLLSGLNNTPILNGVAAVLTFQLASSASGNLAVQFGNLSGASSLSSSLPMSATGGVITVSSVGVAVTPPNVSLSAGQTQQLTATVTGGSGNTAVTWSLSPAVGSISSGGSYTAPASIASQSTVVATATSVADPTKSASSTITLLPAGVSVAVTPATASLLAGQTQQLTATVTGGSGNTAVTWSLSPATGSISASGLYTAPASVTSQQTVVAKATSVADPTKSASATITLLPAAVSVAVTPATASLLAGQAQQLTATVTGGSGNTAVTWSLSPTVGTIGSGGLYTAPASITSQTTVLVKATSVADPTKSASSTITLLPAAVSVTVSPASVTLSAGQSQKLTATVTGGSGNTAVTWTLSPAVGSIGTSGLYTAPASITSQTTVVAKATSVADPTKSASSTVTLLVSTASAKAPTLIQVTQNQIYSGTQTSTTFKSATKAGNAIVAYVIWSNKGTVTLTDSRGDAFVGVGSPVIWANGYSAQVFYATNIAGGTDTVTASFGTAVYPFGVLYIHEYAGISKTNPVDVTGSRSGASSSLNSGPVTTTSANDLIFGAGVSDNTVTAAGAGFKSRDFAYGNITEDLTGVLPGSYAATATHVGNYWGMQVVAFRPGN